MQKQDKPRKISLNQLFELAAKGTGSAADPIFFVWFAPARGKVARQAAEIIKQLKSK
jgi:hypothetical protein